MIQVDLRTENNTFFRLGGKDISELDEVTLPKPSYRPKTENAVDDSPRPRIVAAEK